MKADLNMSFGNNLPQCFQIEAETVKELVTLALELIQRHEADFFEICEQQSLDTLAVGVWRVLIFRDGKFAGWEIEQFDDQQQTVDLYYHPINK
jgi:hypothetical protein